MDGHLKRKEFEGFLRKKEYGSPLPANEILLPFQILQRKSTMKSNKPSSPKRQNFQPKRQLSESSIPIDLIMKADTPMTMQEYKNMTLHIFHSINIIKQIGPVPTLEDDQWVDFSFQKFGFSKVIIFDLDETLIHCQRETEGEEENEFSFQPEVFIDIVSPDGESVKTGFTIRPYALECLRTANKFYEVAIFTAGFDWYANPIIDYIDP